MKSMSISEYLRSCCHIFRNSSPTSGRLVVHPKSSSHGFVPWGCRPNQPVPSIWAAAKAPLRSLWPRSSTIKSLDLIFFAPFIFSARQKAQELNVAELCTFACADLRNALNSARNYDLAIYTAVGDVLGSVAQCVGRLREAIHSRGYMVIDDGFRLTHDPIAFPGYEYYASHEETIHQLTAHGDKIIQEKIFSVAEMKQVNQRNTAFITQSASAIVESHPGLAAALNEFVEQERQECEILERDVASAMWLIEKA